MNRRSIGGTSSRTLAAAATSSARGWPTSTSRGRSFLQQELSGLDDRLGVKAGAHRTVVERVGDRDQGHPLMMRHIGANDRHFLTLRETRRRVVQGLIATIPATAAGRRQDARSFAPRPSHRPSPPAPSRKGR